MHVLRGQLDDPRVIALLDLHLTRARAETAVGSSHGLDLADLKSTDVDFWTIWDDEMRSCLLGVGALRRLLADHGEIKSMHVVESVRRRGVAGAMLRHLIAEARDRGFTRLSLETGSWPYFEPARAFYRRHGFVECPPFGNYSEDTNSIFMTLVV